MSRLGESFRRRFSRTESVLDQHRNVSINGSTLDSLAGADPNLHRRLDGNNDVLAAISGLVSDLYAAIGDQDIYIDVARYLDQQRGNDSYLHIARSAEIDDNLLQNILDTMVSTGFRGRNHMAFGDYLMTAGDNQRSRNDIYQTLEGLYEQEVGRIRKGLIDGGMSERDADTELANKKEDTSNYSDNLRALDTLGRAFGVLEADQTFQESYTPTWRERAGERLQGSRDRLNEAATAAYVRTGTFLRRPATRWALGAVAIGAALYVANQMGHHAGAQEMAAAYAPFVDGVEGMHDHVNNAQGHLTTAGAHIASLHGDLNGIADAANNLGSHAAAGVVSPDAITTVIQDQINVNGGESLWTAVRDSYHALTGHVPTNAQVLQLHDAVAHANGLQTIGEWAQSHPANTYPGGHYLAHVAGNPNFLPDGTTLNLQAVVDYVQQQGTLLPQYQTHGIDPNVLAGINDGVTAAQDHLGGVEKSVANASGALGHAVMPAVPEVAETSRTGMYVAGGVLGAAGLALAGPAASDGYRARRAARTATTPPADDDQDNGRGFFGDLSDRLRHRGEYVRTPAVDTEDTAAPDQIVRRGLRQRINEYFAARRDARANRSASADPTDDTDPEPSTPGPSGPSGGGGYPNVTVRDTPPTVVPQIIDAADDTPTFDDPDGSALAYGAPIVRLSFGQRPVIEDGRMAEVYNFNAAYVALARNDGIADLYRAQITNANARMPNRHYTAREDIARDLQDVYTIAFDGDGRAVGTAREVAAQINAGRDEGQYISASRVYSMAGRIRTMLDEPNNFRFSHKAPGQKRPLIQLVQVYEAA